MLPARWSRIRRPLALGVLAAVVVPLTVALPVAQADDGTERVAGELVQAWSEDLDPAEAAEHADHGLLSWVETAPGEAVRVATEDVEAIPVGSTVEVTLGDEVADAASEEQGQDPAREVLSATVLEAAPADVPPVASAGTVTNRVTVVRVFPAVDPAADTTTSADVAAVVNGAVATFWDEQTDGVVGIEGTAWPTDVFLDAGCNDWLGMWAEAADAVGFDSAAGDHLLLYLANAPANFADCPAGLGTVGNGVGSGGLLYTGSAVTSVIAHEMGHNFGLGHSSSRKCTAAGYAGTCADSEYTDFYDVMGFSWGPIGSLNVAQASRLGSLGQKSFAIGSPVETVALAPVSQRSGTRAIRIDAGPGIYWLEYRPAAARDAWLGTSENTYGLEPGVLLRRESSGRHTSLLIDGTPAEGDLDVALPEDVPVEIAGGSQTPGVITITVTSLSPGGAQVQVSGSPARLGSPLVRTRESASVYLLSSTGKHLVADLQTLTALSRLGPVSFVSQRYLDQWATQQRMGRVVASPSGDMYFLDAGMKLQFSSCTQVADYGGSCDALVRLEQPLIDALYTGPMMTSLYRTTTGKAFFVQGGVKREAVDDAALVAAGMPTIGVTLLESGVASLPYGVPVTRSGVALRNRSTGGMTLSVGTDFVSVSEPVRVATALRTLPVRVLDDASLRRLPRIGVQGAIVKEAGGSRVFLLTEAGKRHLTDPAMLPPAPPEMPASILGQIPDAGTFSGAGFVKGSASGTVYVLREGKRRSVSSWPDLVALNGGDPAPSFLTIDQRVADLLPVGPAQLGPGALVFSPRSPTVFFVNGRAELIPVGSFSTTLELGATRLVRVADVDVAAYTVRNSGIGTAIDCAGTRYLGLGGKLYRVGTDVDAHYALPYTSIDITACAALPKAEIDLTRFLRAADGTIFYMENGLKRPIRSIEAWVALGGTSANTIQSTDFALGLIATGMSW